MVLAHDGKEDAIVTEHLGSEDTGCDAAITVYLSVEIFLRSDYGWNRNENIEETFEHKYEIKTTRFYEFLANFAAIRTKNGLSADVRSCKPKFRRKIKMWLFHFRDNYKKGGCLSLYRIVEKKSSYVAVGSLN